VPPLSKSQEIKVVVYYPKTEEGMRQLSQRVAEAHADAVIHKINGMRGSIKEKISLMQAVANIAKNKEQISKTDNGLSR